jgi:hypothetical protein
MADNSLQRCVMSSLVASAFVSGLVATPRLAVAEDNLAVELRVAAEGMAKTLKGLGESTIAIGQFTGPPQLAASGGPGIAFRLSVELEKLKIKVKLQSRYGVDGRFRIVLDKQSQEHALEVRGEVSDLAGTVVFRFRRASFGETGLARLSGVGGTDLPPQAPRKERVSIIIERLPKPTTACQGTLIQSSPQSPYAIEVLALDGASQKFRPLTPRLEENLAFVNIKRDQAYVIRLVNRSDHDAAVALYIDGLSMFTFSKKIDYTRVIIPKRSVGLIRGWHRDNRESNEFLVTSYAKSPAARILQNTSNIGTVTAMFSAAWNNEKDRPRDEPTVDRRKKSVNATGIGQRVSANYKEVNRYSGVIRSIVSVRYSR